MKHFECHATRFADILKMFDINTLVICVCHRKDRSDVPTQRYTTSHWYVHQTLTGTQAKFIVQVVYYLRMRKYRVIQKERVRKFNKKIMLRDRNTFNALLDRKRFKTYYMKIVQLLSSQHEHHLLRDKYRNSIPLHVTTDLWILTSQLQQFDVFDLQKQHGSVEQKIFLLDTLPRNKNCME